MLLNEYIGLHVTEINGGKTYSETSGESRALATEAEAATKAAPDAPATLALEGRATELSAGRLALPGETLRGLSLTTYGFSIFGERAGQAALVAFAAAIVLLLASIAGFVHAFTTSKDKRILSAATGIGAGHTVEVPGNVLKDPVLKV